MKESETLELKKTTSELKEGIISIAAILNKHGHGELYFGVTDDGEVLGQDVTAQTLRRVRQTISQKLKPQAHHDIKQVSIEGRTCIRVTFRGDGQPYFAHGRAYIRDNDEDRSLEPEEIRDIVLQKNRERLRWDAEICKRAELDDISEQKLRRFVEKAGLEHASVVDSLENLKLIKDGKLTNAAVVLFGKKPEKFFPNAKLRCAVFGTDDTAVILDMHDYEGDLFELIEHAEEYILAHINIGMRLNGLRRVDVPEIDKEAFREAIINAFCHRDYYEYDSVNIAVFRDRVEIRSPGELYGGLTIERIRKARVSKRRNELLADMFHRVHFVERWGTGIKKMLSKEPETTFEQVAGIFFTVFMRKTVHKTVSKTVQKDEGQTRETIIKLIAQNPRVTIKELAEETGLSFRGAQYNIQQLKKEGRLKRVGGRKSGHWEIVDENQVSYSVGVAK